ncbi:MAG: DNA-directed RNA polymerase subunit delta [Bacilli bacterium]|nr:DNA-directed RNA polymerase subunit delta [Bacilli bacterium]
MKNYKNESMVDVAYDVLLESGRKMSYIELYGEVCKKMELSPEKITQLISKFYTNLTLDGRFAQLDNNEWDLRANHKFEEVARDTRSSYDEMEAETIGNIDRDELDETEIEQEGLDDEEENGDESTEEF